MHRVRIDACDHMPGMAALAAPTVAHGRTDAHRDNGEAPWRKNGHENPARLLPHPTTATGAGPHEMIERVTDLVGREVLDQIEMRHLPKGMHARIGAPRAR